LLESRSMKYRAAFFVFCGILLAAQTVTPSEVEITSEPHHRLALENAYVRVFRVEVAPHDATLMHLHRYDYIFVTLGVSHVENDVAGKPPVTLKLQDGETRFLTGGFAHIAKNLSDQPFRNVTIELLQDKKALQSTSKWDEERGLHILHAGTKDILFVKDGVRASELQLQTGGFIPKHHHTGPHLVVAVSDLELRSDVVGQGASTKQLKAGDIAWVKGGFTHTLTNVGRQEAKFITLEFP
jgi:hypothetical protein